MLDAVIHRVSDQVDHRIADLVDDRTVKFRVLTLKHKLHILVQRLAEVANQAREAVEREGDGDHAELCHQLLDISGNTPQLGERVVELTEPCFLYQAFNASPADDQLAHEVHQFVQTANVHSDGLAGLLCPVLLGSGSGSGWCG